MKRTVSDLLDEDLVRALEAGSESLSSQINEAVRAELARRRHRALAHQSPEGHERSEDAAEEALVDKYMEVLTRARGSG